MAATGRVKTYDLGRSLISINGVPVDGFGEGEALVVAFPDTWTNGDGADGEHYRSRTNTGTATATLTLSQSSLANNLLFEQHRADVQTGRGVFAFFMKDWASKSQIVCPRAYIMGLPETSFGAEVGTREWSLVLPDVKVELLGIPETV